jgi:hypothetical protein
MKDEKGQQVSEHKQIPLPLRGLGMAEPGVRLQIPFPSAMLYSDVYNRRPGLEER